MQNEITDVRTKLGDSIDSRIQRALELMGDAHDSQLNVPSIARRAGLSESHFYRLFRRYMQVTPARHLKETRIHQVALRIRTTDLPVKRILADAGVTDRSHFVRSFKRIYGLPPSVYRVQFDGTKTAEN